MPVLYLVNFEGVGSSRNKLYTIKRRIKYKVKGKILR